MSHKYQARNPEGIYFVTFTIVDWVDIFIRQVYKEEIIKSLKYCQDHKGLEIYAFCLMTNHLHLIVAAAPSHKLSDIIRDFKKFTNKRIIELIEQENESRRDWMMYRFQYHAKFSNRIKDYKVWQDGYHPMECYGLKMLSQKLEYVHYNPVRAGIVSDPKYYLYSSAVNYYKGEKGLLDVMLLDVHYAGTGNSAG